MKKYKTCNGCRAYYHPASQDGDDSCVFQYPQEFVEFEIGKEQHSRPTEPCPKPRTTKERDLLDVKQDNYFRLRRKK